MKETKKKVFPARHTLILAGALVAPLALVGLFFLLRDDQTLMSAWVFGVMAPMEQFWGRIWNLFPVSVAEILAFLFLLGCAFWLIRAVILVIRSKRPLPFLRRTAALAAAWLWLWAGLCWLWNAAYYVPSFAQRTGLEMTAYSVGDLAKVTEYFAQNAARLSSQVARDGDGHFAESLTSCFQRGPDIYRNLSSEFPCLSMESVRAKPLLCSALQSRLGFTGIYSPITGEANVNVDAPACLVPATIAHEMAHQRLVSSELECNFIGVAACVRCDDVVFQYSGYLMGLIHLCNALYSVSPDAWYSIAGQYFTPELSQDWSDNNAYWAAMSSPVEDAAEETYDAFLKSNDQELGIRSYGACVDLLVAYFG